MIENKIKEICDSGIGESMSGKYSNSLSLNGFILQKPKFIKNEKTGSESVSFIIHQMQKTTEGQYMDRSFSTISYVPKIIEEMRKVDKVVFINTLSQLFWFGAKKSYYVITTSIEISCTLDIELDEPYKVTR